MAWNVERLGMESFKNIRRILWLGTVIVFSLLIIDSFHGMTKSYPTFDYRIPRELNIQIGNVRFQDVINDFADQFDVNIKEINNDNQRNSRFAFWTNIASLLLALIGFYLESKNETAKSRRAK